MENNRQILMQTEEACRAIALKFGEELSRLNSVERFYACRQSGIGPYDGTVEADGQSWVVSESGLATRQREFDTLKVTDYGFRIGITIYVANSARLWSMAYASAKSQPSSVDEKPTETTRPSVQRT